MSKEPSIPKPSGLRRLTALYILALSAIAILTIAGQLGVQASLAKQRYSSTVINVAGRQRMLSQRITKLALLLAQDDEEHKSQRTKELRSVVAEWQRADQLLRHSRSGGNSPAVAALFDELEPRFTSMLHGAEQVTGGSYQSGLALLLEHEPHFLVTMDAIVDQYDREAQADVDTLRWQERVLLSITLLVLLLEGLLIFRPAVRRIDSTLAALAQAKQVAEAANAEKSRFLARMSHDLRTPLSAILGLVDVQLARPAQDKVEHLLTIRDAAESLLRLMNTLLDAARLEAKGPAHVELAAVDVAEIVQQTIGFVAPQAEAKSLRLTCRFDSELPPQLLTDARLLQQILMNLLANATKFTPSGRIHVNVTAMRTAAETCTVSIAVTDTGVGIPLADQDRIFESFTQLNGSSVDRDGLGLGLSTVARLTEALQGKVTVRSEPQHGSTFTVSLPMTVITAPTDAAARQEHIAERPLFVLVVEDTLANQMVCEQMLELLGHRAVLAESIAEALRFAHEQAFDAVLVDLQLPDGDGCDLLRELRSLDSLSDKPLIAVSAHASPEYREITRAAGASHFISKPLRLAELAHWLGRVSSPGLDLSHWAERPELLQSLIRLFAEEWPRQLQALDDALAARDAGKVQFFAHRLKGLVSNFHDVASLDAAAQLELTAQIRDLDRAPALRDRLAQALEQLNAALAVAVA